MIEKMSRPFVVVDVRSKEEFTAGHLEGAKNIPLQELANSMKELIGIREDILLCCASGHRSKKAFRFLIARGFKNISDAGPWVNLKQDFAIK